MHWTYDKDNDWMRKRWQRQEEEEGPFLLHVFVEVSKDQFSLLVFGSVLSCMVGVSLEKGRGLYSGGVVVLADYYGEEGLRGQARWHGNRKDLNFSCRRQDNN